MAGETLAQKVRFTNLADRPEQRATISSVVVEREPGHWRMTVYNRGGMAGELTILREDGAAFLDKLLPPYDRSPEEEMER
jgi:hypothetical protein